MNVELRNRFPVILYQMGKVASSTVSATLDAWGVENYQVHYLNVEQVNAIAERREEKSLARPHHLDRSLEILKGGILQRPTVKIITMVRDPIARNISAYFQNIKIYWGGRDISEVSSDELVSDFIIRYPHHVPINWFLDEFNPALDLDMFSIPHDRSAPYFSFAHNNFEILVMKAEAADVVKREAIADFLGIENRGDLVQGNVGEGKYYKDSYSAFKEGFQCPNWYLKIMYGSEYARYFYSQEEIETFRLRWKS